MRRDFPTSTEQILEQIAALAEQVRDLTAKVDRVLEAVDEPEEEAVATIGEAGTVAPSVWDMTTPLIPGVPGVNDKLRVRINPDVQVWDPTKYLVRGFAPEQFQTTSELHGIVCSDCKPDTTS